MTFPCTRCGACCRLVFSVQGLAHLDRGDGACRHLVGEPGEEHACAVYEERPALCRVDEQRPEVVAPEWWHEQTLHACDRIHLTVYGQERAHG